ncbi:hypothetical protein ACP70R_006146 [Stipagrostis hirtigluma subsp. patula]
MATEVMVSGGKGSEFNISGTEQVSGTGIAVVDQGIRDFAMSRNGLFEKEKLPTSDCDTARFSSYETLGYVHIDDVASSHVLVYETPEAAGRYLCSPVVLDNNEFVSFLAKRYPILPIPRRSAEEPTREAVYQLNTSKL